MSTSIGQDSLENQLDQMVRNFVKEKLETMIEEEMTNFFDHEHPELKNTKNGHYERQLDTKYGRINELQSKCRETGTMPFRRNCFSPMNAIKPGSEKRLFKCIKKG